MRNTLYYGEMVAKISAYIHKNPDHSNRIDQLFQENQDIDNSIWTLCANAAKVFDAIEDLSSEHFIDWHKALEIYAQSVLDHLLMGHKPHVLDMVSMTARSIENSK